MVDIDDCTHGHYNALLHGRSNERYVLNSFQSTSEELIKVLKNLSTWNGNPVYIPKLGLKVIAPIGDLYKVFSNSPPILCSESARVLTHGHQYNGSKAKDELQIPYTNLEAFIKKTVNWLIDNQYIHLSKI